MFQGLNRWENRYWVGFGEEPGDRCMAMLRCSPLDLNPKEPNSVKVLTFQTCGGSGRQIVQRGSCRWRQPMIK